MQRMDPGSDRKIPVEKKLFETKYIQMQRSLSLNSTCEPRTKPIPESALLQELDLAKSAEHSEKINELNSGGYFNTDVPEETGFESGVDETTEDTGSKPEIDQTDDNTENIPEESEFASGGHEDADECTGPIGNRQEENPQQVYQQPTINQWENGPWPNQMMPVNGYISGYINGTTVSTFWTIFWSCHVGYCEVYMTSSMSHHLNHQKRDKVWWPYPTPDSKLIMNFFIINFSK